MFLKNQGIARPIYLPHAKTIKHKNSLLSTPPSKRVQILKLCWIHSITTYYTNHVLIPFTNCSKHTHQISNLKCSKKDGFIAPSGSNSRKLCNKRATNVEFGQWKWNRVKIPKYTSLTHKRYVAFRATVWPNTVYFSTYLVKKCLEPPILPLNTFWTVSKHLLNKVYHWNMLEKWDDTQWSTTTPAIPLPKWHQYILETFAHFTTRVLANMRASLSKEKSAATDGTGLSLGIQ